MFNQIFCHNSNITNGIIRLHLAQHLDERIEVGSEFHLFDVLFTDTAILDLFLPIHIVKLIYDIIGLRDKEG